jgi:predicted nucleic acid-binding protein
MNSLSASAPNTQRVVFTDASVLYSRVFRDYLLYSATEDVIEVIWSKKVLDEMAKHLIENISGFTSESAELLVAAMNRFYPDAEVNPTETEHNALTRYDLPDEGDRHVFAAALAADADIICTSNIKDFPKKVAGELKMSIMTPDVLLCHLFEQHPVKMLAVHADVIEGYPGTTGERIIAALTKAGAKTAAKRLAGLLSLSLPD